MTIYKNTKFTKRDYEATNIVACEADVKPSDDYEETDASILIGLTSLYVQNGVRYYGYL